MSTGASRPHVRSFCDCSAADAGLSRQSEFRELVIAFYRGKKNTHPTNGRTIVSQPSVVVAIRPRSGAAAAVPRPSLKGRELHDRVRSAKRGACKSPFGFLPPVIGRPPTTGSCLHEVGEMQTAICRPRFVTRVVSPARSLLCAATSQLGRRAPLRRSFPRTVSHTPIDDGRAADATDRRRAARRFARSIAADGVARRAPRLYAPSVDARGWRAPLFPSTSPFWKESTTQEKPGDWSELLLGCARRRCPIIFSAAQARAARMTLRQWFRPRARARSAILASVRAPVEPFSSLSRCHSGGRGLFLPPYGERRRKGWVN